MHLLTWILVATPFQVASPSRSFSAPAPSRAVSHSSFAIAAPAHPQAEPHPTASVRPVPSRPQTSMTTTPAGGAPHPVVPLPVHTVGPIPNHVGGGTHPVTALHGGANFPGARVRVDWRHHHHHHHEAPEAVAQPAPVGAGQPEAVAAEPYASANSVMQPGAPQGWSPSADDAAVEPAAADMQSEEDVESDETDADDDDAEAAEAAQAELDCAQRGTLTMEAGSDADPAIYRWVDADGVVTYGDSSAEPQDLAHAQRTRGEPIVVLQRDQPCRNRVRRSR